MKRLFAGMLVFGLCAGLWFWSGSKDEARLMYELAYETEQKSGPDQAESFYRQVAADYPEAEVALLARGWLSALEQSRKQQQLERQAAYTSVESITQVVESYQAVFKRWPQSLTDFDNGAFIFDSDYLAESVGEGFSVYLALLDESAGYRLWSFPGDAEIGYLLNGEGTPFVVVTRSEALVEIEAAYLVEKKKGPLTFLVPRS